MMETQNGSDRVQVQLATRIPRQLHRNMKLYCVRTETSLQAFVESALTDRLTRETGRGSHR